MTTPTTTTRSLSSAGNIGNSLFDNQGVDVGDSSLTPPVPMELYDWKLAHDVMTYCDDQWLSSYTYNAILANLCGNDKANCPNHADADQGTPREEGRAAARGRGTLNLENGRVSLEPMSALKGLTLTERPKKSDYAIVQRDSRGKMIASYPFEPKEISDLPAGQRLASIEEVVPFSAKTKRIEIVQGQRGARLADVSPTRRR